MAPLGDDRFARRGRRRLRRGSLAAAIAESGADAVLNATDPRFNPQIFAAAFEAGCTYLDMAMTLSSPHPEHPYEEPGVKLGDAQFAEHERWRERGLLALVGIGVEPGLSDVFARYAADELFSEIDEVGGSRRRRPGRRGLRLRADLLDLDDDRGVPQPAARLGARARLLHDRAVLGARDVRVPRGDRPGRRA